VIVTDQGAEGPVSSLMDDPFRDLAADGLHLHPFIPFDTPQSREGTEGEMVAGSDRKRRWSSSWWEDQIDG
jgi:hypothetical protein